MRHSPVEDAEKHGEDKDQVKWKEDKEEQRDFKNSRYSYCIVIVISFDVSGAWRLAVFGFGSPGPVR